jgi:pSer/pThr/pTyr-binding forkhead associated (FHA) protein
MIMNLRVKLRGRSVSAHTIREPATIGRDPECGVFLDNPGISRQHARIEVLGGGFHIRDLHSSNGTFVNGQRVETQELRDRDSIQVGRFSIEVELRQAPSPAPKPLPMPQMETLRTPETLIEPGAPPQALGRSNAIGRIGLYLAVGTAIVVALILALI